MGAGVFRDGAMLVDLEQGEPQHVGGEALLSVLVTRGSRRSTGAWYRGPLPDAGSRRSQTVRAASRAA